MKLIAKALCVLLAVVVLPFTWGEEGGSEDGDALAKIIRDWEQRRQSIRSIEYQLEGQGMIPKGRWTGDPALPASVQGPVPAEDYSYDISMTVILDFQNGFAKTEERNEMFDFPLAKFLPHHRIQVYDGQRYMVHTPRKTNTGAGYTPSAKQPDLWEASAIGSFFTEQALPVLLLSGRFRDDGDWDVRKLDETTNLECFRFAGNGKLSGRDCVILRLDSSRRPANFQEYWLDTGPGSTLLRWIQKSAGHVVFDIRFSYPPGGSEAWPQSWEITCYDTSPQRVYLQNKMRVKSLQLNKQFQRKLFQIERAPGMVVSTRKGFVRVNEDGSVSEVPLFTPAAPTPSEPPWWRSAYLWVSLALLLVVCLVVILGRKRLWAKWARNSKTS